ncbi:hypothetical protein BFX06_13410 [Sulfobacillus thermosulfidooxidans]|nr:hypothetical protein BFX05_10195 [Sulfobacillus thermosulfidooxidans]OLZ17388.1 hypothetical protein BFX06_13410 [Sulfobacillus thermosulfidooxidans]OLZ21102.1 hypothetical protein BFX07_13885 [Sulfobacillus thermosulfidooxidans]
MATHAVIAVTSDLFIGLLPFYFQQNNGLPLTIKTVELPWGLPNIRLIEKNERKLVLMWGYSSTGVMSKTAYIQ